MTKTLATLAATTAFLAVGAPAASALTPLTQAATGVSDHSAVLHGQVTALASAVDVYFVYGKTKDYGSSTSVNSAIFNGTALVANSVSKLEPGTEYHYSFVTRDPLGTDYGPDMTFTTNVPDTSDSSGGTDDASVVTGTKDPAGSVSGSGDDSSLSILPPAFGDDAGGAPAAQPQLGLKVVAGTSSGSVGVRIPGASTFATLAGDAPVPVGSIVDARRGTVRLVTALRDGTTQTGTFHGAVFQVRQSSAGGGMTDLVLRGGSFAACKAGASRAMAAGRSRVVRRLWGTDHHGRFRTRGSNSIATVRGTSWVTTDRCDGTQTRVYKGSVSVRDLRSKKTVLVRAGHSYLARASR